MAEVTQCDRKLGEELSVMFVFAVGAVLDNENRWPRCSAV